MTTDPNPELQPMSRVQSASIIILFVCSLAVFLTAGGVVYDLIFNGVTITPGVLIR